MALPVGLVYDPAGNVVLDPDSGVQHAISHLFETFERTGSARAVVQEFNRERVLFPTRVRTGERKGELAWMPLRHWRVLRTLHNPRYAGAFAYGRRRTRKTAAGKITIQDVPRDQWTALFPDRHPGYLTFEQYEQNLRTLAHNAQAHGTERAAGPAREGPALLQGLAICGRCGTTDDRPLSPAPRSRGTRLSMHGRVHPGRPHALPGRPRARRRRHDQPAAAPDRHPARPGGRAHRPSRTRSTRR